MSPSTNCTAATKSLKLFFLLKLTAITAAKEYTAKEVVLLFNHQYKFNLNIFLKLKTPNDFNEFEEILKVTTATPRMVINEMQTEDAKKIIKSDNKQCLTVVYLSNENRLESFELMWKLLWKLHLTHVLLLWDSKEEILQAKELIFQNCWEKGFINVILWHHRHLYTYNPYPHIQTLRLTNFSAYQHRSYLHNFQHYSWIVPFFQFPPRCFSYTDRWGKLVRTGSYFKIVQLFIQQHNGTMTHYEVDMWKPNVTQKMAVKYFKENGFHFIVNAMFKDDSYDHSNTIWIMNRYLIIPAAQEISKSLYILKPLNVSVWLLFLLMAVVVFCLIYFENNWKITQRQQSSLLETIAVMYSLPYRKFRHSELFTFQLIFINLVATWMLEGYYNSNFSSLLVTKLYEKNLKTLEDVAKTSLFIYEYSVDVEHYKSRHFPPIIYERLISGNNSHMFAHRKNLDIDLYIYCASREIARYYLMQHRYLKHPKATLLPQIMYSQTFYFVLSHGLPVKDLFNLYLLYIMESGIIYKLEEKSYWDGIASGDIKFVREEQESPSFSLEHFWFAFGGWLSGLVVAFVCFLCEIYLMKIKKILKKFI